MKATLLSLVLFAQVVRPSFSDYSTLVMADEAKCSARHGEGIRVTYLGVNGYQFETGEHALLVDPYFTRVSLWRVASNRPIASDAARVAAGLTHVRPRVAAVLVTHAHFDHLLDVPEVMRHTRAQLVADATAANLVQALGVSRAKCSVVNPGDRKTIGPWKISVLAAQHDRLIGSAPPFPGNVSAPAKSPRKASDWKLGQPLAFLIEANGQRIYIDSGGRPDSSLPRVGRVDLAILGVALPDSRKRFARAIRALRPRYILPSHQDDFFTPFDRGFRFGKLTSFPSVLRIYEKEHLPGRLILLDYFRPWTIR